MYARGYAQEEGTSMQPDGTHVPPDYAGEALRREQVSTTQSSCEESCEKEPKEPHVETLGRSCTKEGDGGIFRGLFDGGSNNIIMLLLMLQMMQRPQGPQKPHLGGNCQDNDTLLLLLLVLLLGGG